MPDDDLAFAPAWRLVQWLRRGEVSPVELVRLYLDRIERLNPRLNAFLTVRTEEALEEAKQAEAAVAGGASLGPLHGLPIALKDLTPMAGVRTTFGSAVFRDHVPQRDAPVVERLRAAGAIVIGKTNTPEFGHRGTTENLLGEPCRNPWDLARTPGGSSGGSAVAVAAGLSPMAEGSDGGGSIRIPASFCGVYGIKPTRGRVPRNYRSRGGWGMLPQHGPLARTVRDAALFLQVVSGPHPDDPRTIQEPPPDFQASLETGVRGLRIAWSPDFGSAAVDPGVKALAQEAAMALRSAGAIVEEPDFFLDEEEVRATFFTIFLSEMDAAHGQLLESHGDALMPSLRKWLEEARSLSAADLSRALRDLEWRQAHLRGLFHTYDLLATPTTAVAAFPIEEWPQEIGGRPVDPLWAFNPFCYLFNMTGQPAASVPCGFTAPSTAMREGIPTPGAAGLPVGLQLVGRHGAEATVLRASAALEGIRPWAHLQPPVS